MCAASKSTIPVFVFIGLLCLDQAQANSATCHGDECLDEENSIREWNVGLLQQRSARSGLQPRRAACGTWIEICSDCSGACAQCVSDAAKWQCNGAESTPSGPTPSPPAPSSPTPRAPATPAPPVPAGQQKAPFYGDIAVAACAMVVEGGECGASCTPTPSTKTALDIAKIWTYSTADMVAVAGMPVGGGIASCIGAVTVAMGECQAAAIPGNWQSATDGGCNNEASVAVTAGGLWQASGPLSTADWTLAGQVTVDGKLYKCDQYADDITMSGPSFDGFGPDGSDARSPVCQARIAFAHAANGCAQPSGAEKVLLCLKTDKNADNPRGFLDLTSDYEAELEGDGLPCWADSLCITGKYGSGNWPGPSAANGQTNSFGHYYKSCGHPIPGYDGHWNPYDGNPVRPNPSDWTPTSDGNCATNDSAAS